VSMRISSEQEEGSTARRSKRAPGDGLGFYKKKPANAIREQQGKKPSLIRNEKKSNPGCDSAWKKECAGEKNEVQFTWGQVLDCLSKVSGKAVKKRPLRGGGID